VCGVNAVIFSIVYHPSEFSKKSLGFANFSSSSDHWLKSLEDVYSMRFTAGFPWFPTFFIRYPLVNVYKKLLNMAIEIVDLPMKILVMGNLATPK